MMIQSHLQLFNPCSYLKNFKNNWFCVVVSSNFDACRRTGNLSLMIFHSFMQHSLGCAWIMMMRVPLVHFRIIFRNGTIPAKKSLWTRQERRITQQSAHDGCKKYGNKIRVIFDLHFCCYVFGFCLWDARDYYSTEPKFHWWLTIETRFNEAHIYVDVDFDAKNVWIFKVINFISFDRYLVK